MRFQKSIFITGAASGIGRETALYFADKGWYVGLFNSNDAVFPIRTEIVSKRHAVNKGVKGSSLPLTLALLNLEL